ncbi:hypothetical protein V1477_020842 [Vespula maculifrons]|uniref:Secreted protein n=1 Tax=Vespula maculifrons TaxID=7453 RepID=A0ABD2AN34_VESMC
MTKLFVVGMAYAAIYTGQMKFCIIAFNDLEESLGDFNCGDIKDLYYTPIKPNSLSEPLESNDPSHLVMWNEPLKKSETLKIRIT